MKNPSEYVKSFYDDQKELAETILSEGVPEVSTVDARADNSSGVPLGPHQPSLQSQNAEFSWQNIPWEDKGQAVITGDVLDGSAGYATHIHGSVFDNPLDDHYLYWSTHDYSYIALHTTSDLFADPSEWTFQGEIFSDPNGTHTASPSVCLDPRNNRVNIYYHTKSNAVQYTKLATLPLSGDGTNPTIQRRVLDSPEDDSWDEQERSYLRMYRGGTLGVYQGRDVSNNAAGIGVVHSRDGENLVRKPKPAFDNAHWAGDSPQSYLGGLPALSFIGGQVTLHYNDRTVNEARALPFDQRDSGLMQEGETVYTAQEWVASGKGPAVNEFVVEDEYVYMIYHTESYPSNIGVARCLRGELA